MPRFLALGVAFIALGLSSLAAQQPAPAVGLWQTEGYGLVFDVRQDSVIGYEITKVSCIPTTRAVTKPTPPTGALGAFGEPGTPVTYVILAGKTPNDARVHLAYAASDMIVHRIDRKPAVCDTPTPDTPLSNFDVFAQTWAEQYGFFREKKVDWASVVAANRPRVTDATTPEQLFDIISGMISPLQDVHSYIGAQAINKRFGGVRKTPSFLETREARDSAYALVSAYLTSPLQRFCEGRVEFGMLGPDVGYLRIRGFSGYTKDGVRDGARRARGGTRHGVREHGGMEGPRHRRSYQWGRRGPVRPRHRPSHDGHAVHRVREAGAKRPGRPDQMDRGAAIGGPAEHAAELPRTDHRAHGCSEHQRGRDLHAGAHEPEAEGHPGGRDDPGGLLGRPRAHAA